MNLLELSKLLLDEKLAEQYLLEKGILKIFMNCEKCGSTKLGRIRRGNYKCYGCKSEWSSKKNSILFHYNVSYSKFIGLIKLYELDLPSTQVSKELQIEIRKIQRILELFRRILSDEDNLISNQYLKNISPTFSITISNSKVHINLVSENKLSTNIYRARRTKVPDGGASYYFEKRDIKMPKVKRRIHELSTDYHKFWRYANHQIQKFRGVRIKQFILYMKEIEFRYNNIIDFHEKFMEKLAKYKVAEMTLYEKNIKTITNSSDQKMTKK